VSGRSPPSTISPPSTSHARHLELDLARFQADLADPAAAAQVDADAVEAMG
jgi:hypothetical protein